MSNNKKPIMEGEYLICKKCGYDFIDFDNKRKCRKCNGEEFESEGNIQITSIESWIE